MNDLRELTPAQAVQLGATSLVLYGKLFFPKTFRQESPLFHEEIGQALMSRQHRNIGIEVFRDGAKTTLLRQTHLGTPRRTVALINDGFLLHTERKGLQDVMRLDDPPAPVAGPEICGLRGDL